MSKKKIPRERRALRMLEPGIVKLVMEPLGSVGARQVLIRSTKSTIKHGTEMVYFREGGGPFHDREFDPALRTFLPIEGESRLYPRPVGSMTVGIVEHVGREAAEFEVGERVVGWLPIADYHIVDADRILPVGNLQDDSTLCFDPAIFALGAVHDGRVRFGDTVAVFGLGAIGLFCVQFLLLSGARVFAVSSSRKALTLARESGVAQAIDGSAISDPAKFIKETTRGGVDLGIEASGRPERLQEAIRSVRQCGRVVTLGFYPGEMSGLRLGEEFLHNRIDLVASNPALRWGNPDRESAAWDFYRQRQTVIDAFKAGQLSSEGIINREVPFADSESVLDLVAERPPDLVKVGVNYA